MSTIKTFGHVKPSTTVEPKPLFGASTQPVKASSGLYDRLRQAEANIAPKTPPMQSQGAAKPIFAPTVKATLDDEENTKIAEALKSLGFSDFDLTPIEKSRILYTKDEIKVKDHQYITEYGSEICSEKIIQKLTDLTQMASSDTIRTSLNKIMAGIKRVDIDAIFNKSFLKSFFSRSISTREDYIILEKEITKDAQACKDAVSKLKQHIPVFDEVEAETDKQFRMLSVLIVAGQLRINQEKDIISTTTIPDNDFFAKQSLTDLQDCLSRFERRINNLMLIRQTILMRMSQLRLEEKNFLTLIDQTTDILTLVIPSWKQQMISVFSSKSNGNSEYNSLLNIQTELLQKMSNATGAKNDSV